MSADVDAARAALPRRLRLHAQDVRKDSWLYVADEIEAAADEIERLRREAAIRAEALDVERLAMARHIANGFSGKPTRADIDKAHAIAAEYSRLAGADR